MLIFFKRIVLYIMHQTYYFIVVTKQTIILLCMCNISINKNNYMLHFEYPKTDPNYTTYI